MKHILLLIQIATLLLITECTKPIQSINGAAQLLHLMPKNQNSEYTLNDKNSFTNELNSGWVFKSEKEIELMCYVIVKEQIASLDDVAHGFLYFTTNDSVCEPESSDVIYKLNFSKEKSRFYNSQALSIKKRNDNFNRGIRNSDLSKNGSFSSLLMADLMVKFKYNSNKYYACLNFAKKDKTGFNKEADMSNLKYTHQGVENTMTQIITTKDLLPIYLVVVFYFTLLCFSALFSGLNLGLMSLDLTELKLLMKIGSTKEKKYANKIYPLRKKGNLLLCTILLGNVLVNSTSTLILGSYLEGNLFFIYIYVEK